MARTRISDKSVDSGAAPARCDPAVKSSNCTTRCSLPATSTASQSAMVPRLSARDVGLGARLEGSKQPGHGSGEGVGKPADLRPPRSMPGSIILPVVKSMVLGTRWASPASRSSPGPVRRSLEPPADRDLRPSPLRAGPLQTSSQPERSGSRAILEDVEIDAVGMRKLRPRIGPRAGQDPLRITQPVAQGVEVMNAHDVRRERAAVPCPGHPVRNRPHLDRGQHRIPQDPSVEQVPEGPHRMVIPHVLVHLEHDPRPGARVDQPAGFHEGKRQRLLRQDAPHPAGMSEDPLDHTPAAPRAEPRYRPPGSPRFSSIASIEV